MKTSKTSFCLLTLMAALVVEVHAQSFLTNGLVAYYPFHGNENDASGNGNNGVTNLGATYSTNSLGTVNSSYVFDGSQGISVPNSPSLNPGNQLTLSAWINFGLGGNFNPRIISKKGSQGYQLLTLGTASQRQIAFYADTASVTTVQAVNAGEWVCLTATSDGTNISIYINGILDSSAAGSGFFSNANDLAIGENGDNSLDNFIGLMSDVRIYNRALSSYEVSQLYGYESLKLPFLTCKVNLTTYPQSANRDNGVITVTPAPKADKYQTKDILNILAADEHLEGNWQSNNFPRTAQLATDGSHFFVVDGTDLLVNASDIIHADFGNNQVTSGSQNDTTGLADKTEHNMQILKITFDDSQVMGGKNLKFYLQGVLTQSTTDTTPVNNVFKELIRGNMNNAAGEGSVGNVDFICIGSATVSRLLNNSFLV